MAINKQDFYADAEIYIDGYYNNFGAYPSALSIVESLYSKYRLMKIDISEVDDISSGLVIAYKDRVTYTLNEFENAFKYFFDVIEPKQPLQARTLSSLFIIGGLFLGWVLFKKR